MHLCAHAPAPDDYHRYHVPVAGEIKEVRNIHSRVYMDVARRSTSEIYVNEWASFSTRDYPENHHAKSGDIVWIVMKDIEDARPVVGLVWFHEDYLNLFGASDLELVAHYTPLGRDDEPYEWLSETYIAPLGHLHTGERRPQSPRERFKEAAGKLWFWVEQR